MRVQSRPRRPPTNYSVEKSLGKGTHCTSTGALDLDTDWLITYYLDLGSVLVMGMSASDIVLGVFARAADPASGGRRDRVGTSSL